MSFHIINRQKIIHIYFIYKSYIIFFVAIAEKKTRIILQCVNNVQMFVYIIGIYVLFSI